MDIDPKHTEGWLIFHLVSLKSVEQKQGLLSKESHGCRGSLQPPLGGLPQKSQNQIHKPNGRTLTPWLPSQRCKEWDGAAGSRQWSTGRAEGPLLLNPGACSTTLPPPPFPLSPPLWTIFLPGRVLWLERPKWYWSEDTQQMKGARSQHTHTLSVYKWRKKDPSRGWHCHLTWWAALDLYFPLLTLEDGMSAIKKWLVNLWLYCYEILYYHFGSFILN